MKPGRFSLEAVLQVRANAKKKAEEDLAAAILIREKAEDECEHAELVLDRLSRGLGTGRFIAAARHQGWNALCRQQERCRALLSLVRKADDCVTSCRAKLVMASIDHELVTRLQKKWHAAQVRLDERINEHQLEEFVNARHHLRIP